MYHPVSPGGTADLSREDILDKLIHPGVPVSRAVL
jgi:hypothetical protein